MPISTASWTQQQASLGLFLTLFPVVILSGVNSRLGPFNWRIPMKYRVLIEQDEDGYFVAQVPALPGCVSQGETRLEALENVREAIGGYLKSLDDHQEPVPPSIYEEIVEV